jgi:hypothetical protein
VSDHLIDIAVFYVFTCGTPGLDQTLIARASVTVDDGGGHHRRMTVDGQVAGTNAPPDAVAPCPGEPTG